MRNRHKYPLEWFSIIRPTMLAAAKFRCSDCPRKQREWGYYDKQGIWHECDEFIAAWALKHGFKPHRIALHVCHLDSNPYNSDYVNLSVKCPRCHLKYDREFNRLTRIAKQAHNI